MQKIDCDLGFDLELKFARYYMQNEVDGTGQVFQLFRCLPHIYRGPIIYVPADALAPTGARASTDTVITANFVMYSVKFLCVSGLFWGESISRQWSLLTKDM